jgi:DNA replication and repair protein RecF
MITNIRLQNFRSYTDFSFEFEAGANIIVGPNASGKTNLLEAVMVLAQGSSYRAKSAELIKHNAEWARLDGYFEKQSRTVKIEGPIENPSRTMLIGDKPYRRLSFDNVIPLVYFEPEHLQAITRGPERRRDFVDDLLERTRPGFKQARSAYSRSLAQRNNLLKKGRQTAAEQIFAWNVRLSELGSEIAAGRAGLNDFFNEKLSQIYSEVAGRKTNIKIDYQIQFPLDNYASRMISKLEDGFGQDLERGFTGYGPHREDFIIFINNQPINSAASRGEVRTLLLSLKKLELELVEEAIGRKPILLLDDVLSELDGHRRQALVEMLKDHQSILTTTDADTVLDYFANGSHKLLALSKQA